MKKKTKLKNLDFIRKLNLKEMYRKNDLIFWLII